MNTLESYSIANPKNVTDECAKFVIDDTGSPFILSDITSVNTGYTLSFWIKAENDCTISILGETLTVSTNWRQHSIVFTAIGKNLTIVFLNVGTYYIYHPKLEVGNMVTDWTPAPEDVIDDLNETITENRTSIIEDSKSITLEAVSETYETKADINETKKNVAQLMIDSGNIDMRFRETEVYSELTEADGSAGDRLTDLETVIKFSEDGITITQPNGTELHLAGAKVSLMNGDEQLGLWDGGWFYCGNIVVKAQERAQFGTFAAIPRSDESLMWLKVGDKT